MPLSRQWSFPQTSTTTEANDAVVVTPAAGAPVYVPANYYAYFQVSQANAASVPSAQLTVIAHPV